MEEVRSKFRKRKRDTIIIFALLIVLVIILYLLLDFIGRISHSSITITGDVDVIEVNFDKKDNTSNVNSNTNINNSLNEIDTENIYRPNYTHTQRPNSNNSNGNDNDNSSPSITPSENPEEKDNGFFAYDSDIEYEDNTNVNIFKQTSSYTVGEKIAPGSKNIYQFAVKNENSFNIAYDIDFDETNSYGINLKYKLKLDGKYVIGDENTYVGIEELKQINMKLAKYDYHYYTLEWKWIEDSNDTEIGKEAAANYNLNIKIFAEQI